MSHRQRSGAVIGNIAHPKTIVLLIADAILIVSVAEPRLLRILSTVVAVMSVVVVFASSLDCCW